uniref:carbohydrate sulfotransferase 6-like n=1 Tax=Semicossyphus pulcher TaxID=241346 RepID=UPI0037E90B82
MGRCKVKFRTMIFLVILQGAAVVLFSGWYMTLSPPSFTPSNSKSHVLLLSTFRSGSSFLGHVFNQHPSVFYLFEPAWHVWTSLRTLSAQMLQMAVSDLLQSVFQCDFSTMEAYLPQKPRMASMFMWAVSRALCSPPACPLTPRGNFSDPSRCFQACNAPGLQGVQEACSTYSHVVLKVVRVLELESLYPLFRDPNLDLRIIHLVRDPRAVMRSREGAANALISDNAIVLEQRSIPEAEVQYQVLQEICLSHMRINERAILKPPPFLKGRYKMVRYEDVVRNPIEEINDMYEFVGLEMSTQLKEWIYKFTHGKGRGTHFILSPRNATEVSQAWRSTLSHDKVEQVQEVCEGAMSLLGYRMVQSEEEQKSLDIDLLCDKYKGCT